MMTRQQREAAYSSIRILRSSGNTSAADAVSQALADLHEYETARGALVEPSFLVPERTIYTYWVTYNWQSPAGHGPGSVPVTRPAPIRTEADVIRLRDDITEVYGFSQVAIQSWTLLEG